MLFEEQTTFEDYPIRRLLMPLIQRTLERILKNRSAVVVAVGVSLSLGVSAQESDGPQPGANSEERPAIEVPSFGAIFEGRSCLPAMSNVQARNTRSLDGQWQYTLDALGEINRRPEKTRPAVFEDVRDADIGPNVIKEYDWVRAPLIEVPGSWNAQIPQLTWYDQWMWLKKHFNSARNDQVRRFVYFEGANYETVVYLNGERVGEHVGGFTPFCFEVTDLLKDGENTLVVGVNAEQDEMTIPPKRADWSNFGGITRPVHLVEVPPTHVSNYALILQTDGKILFTAQLDGENKRQQVHVRIPDLGIDRRYRGESGSGTVNGLLEPRMTLSRWSPGNPVLYDVEIESGGETIQDRIGFRTIEARDGELLLNGEPIFLKGISLHEETVGVAPDRYMTDAAARTLLREVKDGLNGNFVRLAHYPHSEAMIRAADDIGLLVWSEIPVYWDVAFSDPAVLTLARTMQGENVYRDMNRASVVIWSVANETLVSDARNSFLRQLIEDTRQLDPSRPISMASHTLRSKGGAVRFDDPVIEDIDIVSVNYYRAWYSDGPLDELKTIEWANNSGKPMVFSEFGAGALAGFHSDENRKFSEEFQAAYYEAMIEMLENIPSLRGSVPWLLKDFRSPRRFHPEYQNGWNRKGVIAPNGRRKLAFDVLADWYKTLPDNPVDAK
ncbi:MAG: glycoside hydrolase family 2 TIM barrel-domain containing protein [Pseudomonadota bacterium]